MVRDKKGSVSKWTTQPLAKKPGKNWPLPFLKKQSSILPSFPN